MNDMKSMHPRIIANKQRMGNFETPVKDIECLRSMIQYPSEPFSLADFCAGSGRALSLLAADSSAVTFGIEPNDEKYFELRNAASHALYGGYEEGTMSNRYFRMVYCNPPYDYDSEGEKSKGDRKEKLFLKHHLRYVSDDGLFIYNIPKYRMEEGILNLLVSDLYDLRMYRSHDDTYQQVLTFGYRRKQKFLNQTVVEKLQELLAGELPHLPIAEEPIYRVTAGNTTPKYFRSSRLDVDQLRNLSRSSSLVKKTKEWTTPKPPAAKTSPLLPDKEMHRVLRMAAGHINGVVGSGDHLHVLKGTAQKHVVVGKEEYENHTEEVSREFFKIVFKTVDRHGRIRLIEG